MKHRPAFTLVERLVVIAIIGVRVALRLPAVQAAQEAEGLYERICMSKTSKRFVVFSLLAV